MKEKERIKKYPYKFIAKKEITSYQIAIILENWRIRSDEIGYDSLPKSIKKYFIKD